MKSSGNVCTSDHCTILWKQRHHFSNNGPYSQSYGFSSSHVWMWELDQEDGWALKNLWFWNVVLEKTLESPLDYKEIQPVHPKGNSVMLIQFNLSIFFFLVVLFPRNTPSVAYENKPWIFIGRTDVEAEAPIIWPCNAKSWLIGKDWCWERLKAGGEGDDQGWDGWMTSPTQWTHIWTNSRKWITG